MATYNSFNVVPGGGNKGGFPVGAVFIVIAICIIMFLISVNREEETNMDINKSLDT